MKKISYAIIKAAKEGDNTAIEYILNHYDGYIQKRSICEYQDESGNTHSFVDDDLYNAGRSAVLNAIMAFQFIEPSANSHQ